MKIIFLVIVSSIVFVYGCKIRTINDNKPPRDGVLRTSSRETSGEMIEIEKYYENGRLVKEISRYANKSISTERYLRSDKQRYDSLRNYYRNGQLRFMVTSTDTGRVLYQGYYENGTPESAGDSSMNVEYYENGKTKFKALLKQGQIYHITAWYSNGKRKEESEWWNDQRNGKWFEWDSTGRQQRSELYTNGNRRTK